METDTAALPSAFAGQTILGCPISSILALEATCSVTNIPACATATSVNYDAACCGSISAYGSSVGECFLSHAPTCLDTSAAVASFTEAQSATNPCAAYAGGAGKTTAAKTTSAAASETSSSESTSATNSTTESTSAGAATTGSATQGSTSATNTASGATTSASGKSAAVKVDIGLKIYIGAALIGALAVLNM